MSGLQFIPLVILASLILVSCGNRDNSNDSSAPPAKISSATRANMNSADKDYITKKNLAVGKNLAHQR